MNEYLKTPGEIKGDLIKKLKCLRFIIKDMEKPISTGQLNKIKKTVDDYLTSYANNEFILKQYIHMFELCSFRAAYHEASMLAMNLNEMTFDNDNIAHFPPKLIRHHDLIIKAFDSAINCSKNVITELINILNDHGIHINNEALFISAMNTALSEGKSFNEAVITIATQGRRIGVNFYIDNKKDKPNPIKLRSDLFMFNFLLDELHIIINNCLEERMRGKRYIVGIPKKRLIYMGNNRPLAWFHWFLNHKKGAEAFDRRSWISNPAYWLTGDSPDINYFSQ